MLLNQKNKVLLICLVASIFLLNYSVLAQNKELGRGYYVNAKGAKIEGFFDLEFINNNLVRFKSLKQDGASFLLPIEDVSKIVLPTDYKDSSVILTQNLIYKDVKEKVYVQYLQKGDINLFRGYSKVQNEVFFISRNDLPELRRINRGDPKQFLFTYFKGCEDAKRVVKDVFCDKASLEFALRQFAECTKKKMEPVYKVKTQVLKKKPISVGFLAQTGFFKPALSPGYGQDFKLSSTSSALGLNIEVQILGRFSLSSGFNYVFNNMHTTTPISLYPNMSKIVFNKREFVPIEFKYKFKKEQNRIGYGLSAGLFTSKYVNLEFDGYQQQMPTAERALGFLITGSMNAQLTKKFGVEFGARVSGTYATIVPPTPLIRVDYNYFLHNTINFDAFARIMIKLRE